MSQPAEASGEAGGLHSRSRLADGPQEQFAGVRLPVVKRDHQTRSKAAALAGAQRCTSLPGQSWARQAGQALRLMPRPWD